MVPFWLVYIGQTCIYIHGLLNFTALWMEMIPIQSMREIVFCQGGPSEMPHPQHPAGHTTPSPSTECLLLPWPPPSSPSLQCCQVWDLLALLKVEIRKSISYLRTFLKIITIKCLHGNLGASSSLTFPSLDALPSPPLPHFLHLLRS